MSRAYYNENDRHAAAWLRELIAADLIAHGDVDERSICDVRPHELAGYTQQHFFAGIGGWSYALRLAGWPDSRPVRTGSSPCQPFSQAGKGLGEADTRHLWPVFRDLITFGEPTVTFGEQVASAAGKVWLARVRVDLEGLGYAVGAADLCAAGVGAPHIRQRLFWVADSQIHGRHEGRRDVQEWAGSRNGGGLGHANGAGPLSGRQAAEADGHGSSALSNGGACRMEHTALPEEERLGIFPEHVSGSSVKCGHPTRRVGHTTSDNQRRERESSARNGRPLAIGRPGPWSDFDPLPCTDGKARRVESGTFPLAHGVPGRVGLLRGYGNAIVPEAASEFIQAFCET